MDKITAADSLKLHEVLYSQKLTDKQKAEFIKMNSKALNINREITREEFNMLMLKRPLIRFRPLKNSFTKKGDALLLAKSLNIDPKDVKTYINNTIENLYDLKEKKDLNNLEKVKTYILRHGTKAQVLKLVEYELADVKFTLEKLYKLLDDNSGGLVDYFSRPVHRLDNRTLAKLYNTIDNSLKNSAQAGFIDKKKLNSTAEWALVRIYQIQNNSKIIRACEIYNEL